MLALLPLRVHDKHRGVLTTQLCSSSYACPLRGLLWRRTSEGRSPCSLWSNTPVSVWVWGGKETLASQADIEYVTA